MISVRKSKREEKLRKRRNMKASKSSSSTGSSDPTGLNTNTLSKSAPLLDLATLSKCMFCFPSFYLVATLCFLDSHLANPDRRTIERSRDAF